jgi:hypothetical protein
MKVGFKMNELGLQSPFLNKSQIKTNDSLITETICQKNSSLDDIAAIILVVFLLNGFCGSKNKVHEKQSELILLLILILLRFNNSKMNKLNEEGKVNMSKAPKDNSNENNFKIGKAYYFDKSGFSIDECERQEHSECTKIIETCFLIQNPRGFKLTHFSPRMCFNLSGLSCVKNPIIQKIILEACECEHPKQCEVVAGYEIRAVGEVNFSISLPICPIDGFCFPKHSYSSDSSTVPVNEIISHTCCPNPCACDEPCVDWTYAYFCTTLVEEDCDSYIKVKMGVALESSGACECDEE